MNHELSLIQVLYTCRNRNNCEMHSKLSGINQRVSTATRFQQYTIPYDNLSDMHTLYRNWYLDNCFSRVVLLTGQIKSQSQRVTNGWLRHNSRKSHSSFPKTARQNRAVGWLIFECHIGISKYHGLPVWKKDCLMSSLVCTKFLMMNMT